MRTYRLAGVPSPMGRVFQATAFASPDGPTAAAAMGWRVGWILAPGRYELEDRWRDESLCSKIEIPATAFAEKGTYRVRARWRDKSGRCGHWSSPVAVVTK